MHFHIAKFAFLAVIAIGLLAFTNDSFVRSIYYLVLSGCIFFIIVGLIFNNYKIH